tara:strand:- start:513 stop:650 length:138 start_codon:yes stop_codon:yes gene_type:complete
MLFIFKLAENLGHTVHWIMNNMTSFEMEGWREYYQFQNAQQKHRG